MAFNRKKVEDKIYSTLDKLDVSGLNSDKYRKLFKTMSDKQFLDYFKRMANDESNNFYLEIDLYGKNNPKMKNIKAAADYLDVPLEEYVYIRHKSPNEEVIRTKFKVPIVYLHIKRMQQILSKKVIMNNTIAGPGVRSRITGSLSDKEKAGRLTDADTVAFLSISNDIRKNDLNDSVGGDSAIIAEILGARSDNINMKMQLQNEISTFGDSNMKYYKPEKIPTSQAVNTLDVFLIGAGLKSDVVTPTITTRQGLRNKET